MVTRKQATTDDGGTGGTETETSGFTEEQRTELAALIAAGNKAQAEGDKTVKVTKEGAAPDEKLMSAREIEALVEENTRKAVQKINDAAKVDNLGAKVEELDAKTKEAGKPRKQVSAFYRFVFGDPPE